MHGILSVGQKYIPLSFDGDLVLLARYIYIIIFNLSWLHLP